MKEAIAWVKSGPATHEVVQIVPDPEWAGDGLCQELYAEQVANLV